MYVILKRNDDRMVPLIVGQDIFPRPTPWKVAFQAFASFLRRDRRYQMILVKPGMKLTQFEIDREMDTVVLRVGDEDVDSLPVVDLTWGAWWEFAFQSFVHGLFLVFWKWRWA